ncbi:MAG: response regulator, partial [Deltaproteobacteria bacterium]
MSILIVDDSNTDILIIKDILAEAGYADVLTASSAAEAFSFFNLQDNTNPPPTEIELIFMDIFMPGMDGLEACKHIKEIESLKDIPVIVVTARANDENLSLAFKKGASDYIKKPINKIELLARVRSALRLGQEINERRKAEESLRAFEKAIENMQIGVTITDLKGDILYVNPADAKMHGYDPYELPGQSVRIFSPQELWKPLTVKQLMKLKSRRRESTNVKKDGTVFPVQLLSDIVTNAEGKAIGVVTTCENITERKRSEDSLKKAQEELEKRVKERTKELLAANIALNKEVAEKLALQAET